MASVWKHPKSQFWTACFKDKDGRKRKRSTKMTDRKKAQGIADAYEAVARGKRSLTQVRRVMADLAREIMGREMKELSLADYVARWVAARRGEVSRATYDFYNGKSKRFLRFMEKAGRCDATLMDVQREDFAAWRDEEGQRVSAKTVNHALKLLRMIFRQAKLDGLVADDPTEGIKGLSTKGLKVARRPFSQDELALVLRNADAEWRSMIMFAYYTSHRLADIARLVWRDLDIETRKVRFVAGKTGTLSVVPMHDGLFEHVLSLSAPDDPNVPVHARAFATLQENPRSPALSNEFAAVLVKAGLRGDEWRKGAGAKLGGRRRGSELSFHSLRHTNISELQKEGVSAAVAGDIAGHKSAAMTRVYTHMDDETKRRAIAKLKRLRRHEPDLFDWADGKD